MSSSPATPTLATLSDVEAARTALYRREGAGEVIAEEEWLAIGDAQIALTAHKWSREGYWMGDLPW